MILNNVAVLNDGVIEVTDVYFEERVFFIRKGLSKGLDCKGLFLVPGLINSHVHLGSRLVAGAAVGMGKYDYYDNVGFSIHSRRKDADVYKAALLACIESLKCGVTRVDTMDMNPEIILKALRKSGINYSCCLPVKDSYAEAGDVSEQFTRSVPLGTLGLANEFECTPQLLRQGLDFARANSLPIHMHACETLDEVNHFRRLTGKRTIEYLNDIGMLDFDVRLAHCTYADSKDILYLASHDVPVLHCPTSNKAISDKVPPVNLMLRNKVKVFLGTDSFAWNPNASIMSEAWVSHESAGVSVLQAYLMTHESFTEGVDASFSLVSMESLRPYSSVDEFITKLMLNFRPERVYVKGKELVRDGKLLLKINESKLLTDVSKARSKLLK